MQFNFYNIESIEILAEASEGEATFDRLFELEDEDEMSLDPEADEE